MCVAILAHDKNKDLPSSQPCVLSYVVDDGLTYLTLTKDSQPMAEVHNNCGFAMHIGQTSQGTAAKGKLFLVNNCTIIKQR